MLRTLSQVVNTPQPGSKGLAPRERSRGEQRQMRQIACAVVLALLASLYASVHVAPRVAAGAEETPRPFIFGLNPGTSDEELQAAKAAGCTNIRIGGAWDLVERERGVYDWSHGGDREVEQCLKYGLEPFFLIVATPKWALAPEKRDKPWGWAPEPEFYEDARRFYRTLAARHRGKVRYYEFWNEENGYGWNAVNKPDEYAPILKLAYTALKEGDPDCVVAIGGLDGAGWKGYPHYLERLYELGCGDHFDAVAVHPYRVDGPIDGHSLKRIHEILVRHGHGDRKLWLTEYGWSNEYGHDNKARWLKESLDMLSSPEYDFVFQASVHTLRDFDRAEYGLCDAKGNPRAAYQVFRDYPKDWSAIIEQRKKPKPSPVAALTDGFEKGARAWTPFGEGVEVVAGSDIGVGPEEGRRVLRSGPGAGQSGGAYLRIAVPERVPVLLSARVFTHHDDESTSACRVGIDPEGATDPDADSIVWGRSLQTYDAWDAAGVGQGDPIYPNSDHVTLFLRYDRKRGTGFCLFDQVEFVARPDPFHLPEVQPIPRQAQGRPPESKMKAHLTVDFEQFRVVDWGIGHDVSLPVFGPEDDSALMRPRNDGGNWDPFYWEKSTLSRSGQSLAIRLVRPSNEIRGCGVDLWLRGKHALPPDRDVMVSVWTNCSRQDGDFTTVVLGWQPGDYEGTMGGIQEYVELDQRRNESGWKRQTLRFRSHSDPEVGDVIGLAFAGHTKRKTKFRCSTAPEQREDCKDVVAVQPTLSAYFDDLVISLAE